MENRKSFFHLHMISDSTGETLISAGRAATAQFRGVTAIEHVYPLIRSKKQVKSLIEAIDREPGIVLYTLVDRDLSALIEAGCHELGLPCVNVLAPIVDTFHSHLGAPYRGRVGAQHVLNADYFARIEALNFAMDHDDGQATEDYDEADIVIIGISRTSKTPTSIYLAYRGYKTANFPVVSDMPLPENLATVTRPLVVGLIATSDRISQVRENRVLGVTPGYDRRDYLDRATITEELKYMRALCARNNWPVIDVTRRSIEETAAAIIALRMKVG